MSGLTDSNEKRAVLFPLAERSNTPSINLPICLHATITAAHADFAVYV